MLAAFWRLGPGLLCLVALAGCAAVASRGIGSGAERGLVYALPTTRMLIVASLNADRDQLKIDVSQPDYLADEAHRYVLSSVYSPGSAENFSVAVNDRGLLTSVELTSDGQLDQAIVAAVRSATSLLEAAIVENGRIVVFEEFVDPERLSTDPAALRALNARLDAAITAMQTARRGADAVNALRAAPEPVRISLRRMFDAPPAPDTAAPRAADCGSGICYRTLVTYEVTARFADGVQRASMFRAPNGSPTHVAAVERGLFTTWKTTVTLSNGVLTSYKLDSGSELAAAALLPAEMVGAAVAGLTQRGALFNARTSLIDSQIRLADKKEAARKAVNEAAITGSAPLLSVTIGTPDARPVTGFVPGPQGPQTGVPAGFGGGQSTPGFAGEG